MSGFIPFLQLSQHWPRTSRWAMVTGLTLLLSACAATHDSFDHLNTPPKATGLSTLVSGRMSLRIDSQPVQLHQLSFSGWVEPRSGLIEWFAPTGQSVAQVWWSETGAAISRHAQRVEGHPSLRHLSRDLTGTELPAEALSDWTQGKLTPVEGWSLEKLSEQPLRLQAIRVQPAPAIRLILLLENAS